MSSTPLTLDKLRIMRDGMQRFSSSGPLSQIGIRFSDAEPFAKEAFTGIVNVVRSNAVSPRNSSPMDLCDIIKGTGAAPGVTVYFKAFNSKQWVTLPAEDLAAIEIQPHRVFYADTSTPFDVKLRLQVALVSETVVNPLPEGMCFATDADQFLLITPPALGESELPQTFVTPPKLRRVARDPDGKLFELESLDSLVYASKDLNLSISYGQLNIISLDLIAGIAILPDDFNPNAVK